MNLVHYSRTAAVALACWGLVLPPSLQASEPLRSPGGGKTAVHVVQDVALGPGGTLRGRVVDPQGHGQGGSVVVIRRFERDAVRLTTDDSGRFAIGGLRGGVWHISTGSGGCTCRAWAADAAPPVAADEVLLVRQDVIQRGQMPMGEFFGSGPFLLAVVIAAAIAIPVAVHNSKSGS